MDANFKISDIETGKSIYINTLGTAYEYDSINFIVEAKRSFTASTIFEAQFYDSNKIKFFSSYIVFDPPFSQWQTGDRSRANIELPDVLIRNKIQDIRISQFP